MPVLHVPTFVGDHMLVNPLHTNRFKYVVCRVQELDISLLRIRDVGTVFAATAWPHLRELDVSGNALTTLAPLRALPALRVLIASGNRLGAVSVGVFEFGESSDASGHDDSQGVDAGESAAVAQGLLDLTVGNGGNNGGGSARGTHPQPLLPHLEVLQLGDNRLASMDAAQARALPALRSLFLQNNAIHALSGISGCTRLEELVRMRVDWLKAASNCLCTQPVDVIFENRAQLDFKSELFQVRAT